MITIKNICDYAGTNPAQRNFIEGERIYKGKFIISCGKNSVCEETGKTSFTAMCLQTSAIKDKNPHEINVEIKANGDVVQCFCSCKAGLGEKCKHIVGTLLYIYEKGDTLEFLSCTDKKCAWKQDHSKTLKQFDTAPLMEHSCFADPHKNKKIFNSSSIKKCYEHVDNVEEVAADNYINEVIHSKTTQPIEDSCNEIVEVTKKITCASKTTLSQSEINAITDYICSQLPDSALAKHRMGRHDPITVKKQSKVNEDEMELIRITLENQDCLLMPTIKEFQVPMSDQMCCENTVNELSENLESICENTKKHYAHWIRERQYRITGSICYGLYTYTNSKRSDSEWKMKFESTFAPKNFKSKAMEHGSLTESEARDAFRLQKKGKYAVIEFGLIVSKLNPWLAYSPDGVLFKDKKPAALLEIKCPFIGKTKGIQETVDSQLKKSLVLEKENIVMKKKHAYYGQIQLGMAVLNLPVTYFVLYSSFDKNLFMLKVQRDDLFIIKMLKALKKVHFNFRLHEICLKKMKKNNTNKVYSSVN